MRLDRGAAIDARHIVNKYSEKELTDIIFRYGEERWAKRIAKYICRYRDRKPLETASELAELVLRAIPARYHVKNIHPATRVFQALRIAVNDELSAIEVSLRDAAALLETGGRIMAISFHSLEDRVVKNSFRRMAKGCVCGEESGRCLCDGAPVVKVLTKKPLSPAQDEVAANNRARSARMRVCEKL
jgi:16S rRNA (cytosine1402-N4)-methyltransferase